MFKGRKRYNNFDDFKRAGSRWRGIQCDDRERFQDICQINHEKIRLGCEVLSDMILNSTFELKRKLSEKGVIIEEINMYHDNPLMH